MTSIIAPNTALTPGPSPKGRGETFAQLMALQAQWLAPARARLLRRADIARRRRVLDLGCGGCAVVAELAERSGGEIVALDSDFQALKNGARLPAGAAVVCGDAHRLPLADESFDLVFSQMALLWMDVPSTAREAWRVLKPGGVLTAIEPDFGGLIEHPPQIAVAPLWITALRRAGADPLVGRRLPEILAAAGFRVRVDFLDRLEPPDAMRFEMLAGLPLEDAELTALEEARRADAALDNRPRVAHLPLFLVTAEKSPKQYPNALTPGPSPASGRGE
jgi:SAM-dependent methyltransferase